MINSKIVASTAIVTTLAFTTSVETVAATEFARYNNVEHQNKSQLANKKLSSDEGNPSGDQKQIHNKTSAVTVKITGAVEGSGVIIKSKAGTYTVLTAWHVIKDTSLAEDLNISTFDNKSYLANPSSKQRIGESDMATIEFRSQANYETARTLDIDYERNLPIIVTGYPTQKDSMEHSDGYIVLSSVKYIDEGNPNVFMDQGYQLIYSNNTKKGISGGGIFTTAGELIGIHGRGELDRQATLRKNFLTKSGVSYGMPINLILNQSKATDARLNRVTITNPDAITLDIAINAATTMVKGEERLLIALADEILNIKKTFPALYLKHRALNAISDLQANLDVLNEMLELKALTTIERRLALTGRAGVLSVLNRVDEALADNKELLLMAETNDQKASNLRTIGNLLERNGRQKEATTYYAQIESMLDQGKLSDMESFLTYQSAALNANRDRKNEDAEKYILKALSYSVPESFSKTIRLFLASDIYSTLRKYNEGLEIINEYIQKDALDVEALNARGDLYMRTKKDDLLEANAKQVLDFMPRNATALFHMSMAYVLRKNITSACYYFHRMVEEMGEAGFHDNTPLHEECKNLSNHE